MKNIYIIVQSNHEYGIDWGAFKSPENSVFFLISCSDYLQKSNQNTKDHFCQIYETNEFSLSTLSNIVEKIYEKAYQEGDKVWISSVREFDLINCALLREQYSMQGPTLAVINNFRNKLDMKKIVSSQGIRIPKYQYFNKIQYEIDKNDYIEKLEQYLGYPMFAKPIDSAGSIETTFISNRNELNQWCAKYQFVEMDMEIDEFIDGDLFHCDSIIVNGKPVYTFVSKYLHPNADAQKGKQLATMTLPEESIESLALKQFALDSLACFPALPDGCTHLEIFKSKKTNELIFLEVGARPPGGKVPEMYTIKTQGVDVRALHHYLGLGIEIPQELIIKLHSQTGPYASMCYMVNPPIGGVIEKRIEPKMDSSYQIEWNCIEGNTIAPPCNNGDIVGSLVIWNSNFNNLERDFYALDDYQPIQFIEATNDHTQNLKQHGFFFQGSEDTSVEPFSAENKY